MSFIAWLAIRNHANGVNSGNAGCRHAQVKLVRNAAGLKQLVQLRPFQFELLWERSVPVGKQFRAVADTSQAFEIVA